MIHITWNSHHMQWMDLLFLSCKQTLINRLMWYSTLYLHHRDQNLRFITNYWLRRYALSLYRALFVVLCLQEFLIVLGERKKQLIMHYFYWIFLFIRSKKWLTFVFEENKDDCIHNKWIFQTIFLFILEESSLLLNRACPFWVRSLNFEFPSVLILYNK